MYKMVKKVYWHSSETDCIFEKTFNFIFDHKSCHFHVRKSRYGRGYIHVCVSFYFILLWKFNEKKWENPHIEKRERMKRPIYVKRLWKHKQSLKGRVVVVVVGVVHVTVTAPPPPTLLACSYLIYLFFFVNI